MDWSRIATKLNAELARQRLSAQALARRAGVDRKTVDRLRAGQGVRQTTLTWIEQALGVSLVAAPPAAEPARLAALDYGGYSYELVRSLLGDYLYYRRSFDVVGRLVASHLEVHWDEQRDHLCFVDYQHNRARGGARYEYRFAGDVLVPVLTMIFLFLTLTGGNNGTPTLAACSLSFSPAPTFFRCGAGCGVLLGDFSANVAMDLMGNADLPLPVGCRAQFFGLVVNAQFVLYTPTFDPCGIAPVSVSNTVQAVLGD